MIFLLCTIQLNNRLNQDLTYYLKVNFDKIMDSALEASGRKAKQSNKSGKSPKTWAQASHEL